MVSREVRLGKKPYRKCGEEAHGISRYTVYCFLDGDTKLWTSHDPRRSREERITLSKASRLLVICNIINPMNRINILYSTRAGAIGYGSPNSGVVAMWISFPA